MNKRVVVTIFIIALILALPAIVKFFKGDFNASQIFAHNPIEDVIKSVVLHNYPEWKPIEAGLEELMPSSSVSVSISTLYAQQGKQINLVISITTDSKLTNDQIELAKERVCNILGNKASKYAKIEFSVSDLKLNSSDTLSTNFVCK